MEANYERDAEQSPELCADCDVTAHTSCPDRVVFVEADNTDGWIATDYTVELSR
ncbi:hypothetical protein [Halovenus halobia]|uniref:hypothetical protein n=1 Tax=Halovenus halobia TaxID=3396622 RepID=UPI003F562855